MAALDWPDTTHQDPPRDHHWASAMWLIGRHPHLARLVERVPGAAVVDEDGDTVVDLDLLGEAFAVIEANKRAWQEYSFHHREPREDADWERWRAAGPRYGSSPDGIAAAAIAPMSSSEIGRLRLLAFWSAWRVGLKIDDVRSFDANGQRLIADWCRAVQAA